MKRSRTLITPPLKWRAPTAAPVHPPIVPVLAERGGTQLKVPRPVLLVDTREQNPFDCSRFVACFAGIEKKALKLGDYSIAGLEDLCVLERKDLPDLVHSFTVERSGFVNRLRQMAPLSPPAVGDHRLPQRGEISLCPPGTDPNRITQSLVAVLAGLQVPFLCTETHELGEELVASYLYQVHLYHWLEANDYGRFLTDNDL
jgi:hypothetical protein